MALPFLLLIYWYTDNPSMKFWWFCILFLFLLFTLLTSPSTKANYTSFYQLTEVECLFSRMESIAVSKYHLFCKSLIFTTFTSIDFHFTKCVSPAFWNMHESLHIFSLICGFNLYTHIQGKQLSYSSLLLSFNRQCIQKLIRVRCCVLPAHIKQKNNEHPDYIRRTVTKDI